MSTSNQNDLEQGLYRGRAVARVTTSPDGYLVLIGKTARDNDVLTFKLSSPRDFWFHVSGESGSHVVVANPENESRLPRETERFAAALAAGYSKAGTGGEVAVHWCRREEVKKPKGFPPGMVQLRKFKRVKVRPRRLEDT